MLMVTKTTTLLQAHLEELKGQRSSSPDLSDLQAKISHLQHQSEQANHRLLVREKEVADLRYSLDQKKAMLVRRDQEMSKLSGSREKGSKVTQTDLEDNLEADLEGKVGGGIGDFLLKFNL